jgi:hypothetical protein
MNRRLSHVRVDAAVMMLPGHSMSAFRMRLTSVRLAATSADGGSIDGDER